MTPDERFMGQALGLARRAYGRTSPNPMVGAVLVRKGRVIGRGWHHRAGAPHAEVEALADAARRGHAVQGSTIYVTLEPCCTHGRTPPCTEALVRAGVSRVVVAAIDPNPSHAGQGGDPAGLGALLIALKYQAFTTSLPRRPRALAIDSARHVSDAASALRTHL